VLRLHLHERSKSHERRKSSLVTETFDCRNGSCKFCKRQARWSAQCAHRFSIIIIIPSFQVLFSSLRVAFFFFLEECNSKSIIDRYTNTRETPWNRTLLTQAMRGTTEGTHHRCQRRHSHHRLRLCTRRLWRNSFALILTTSSHFAPRKR
jgi:hypothetical protein